MEFSKTYPSGLRVVGKVMPSLYTASLGVFVNVGSIREQKQCNGFSHFIEHLLFKGTKRFSAQELSEQMDNIGADINAFTSKDTTCFFTKSASGDLEKCIDVLSDMYFNASFDEVELQRERNVVLEEIMMSNDQPEDVCQDLIAQALYRGQKIGQTILGNAENIRYCDRHSIINFKNQYYIPQNTVVSVAGNFDIDTIDRLVEKYFESCFQKKSEAVEDEEQSGYSSDFLSQTKDVEQVHLAMSFPGQSMDSKSLPEFLLMSRILGGGLSSRLFQTIREKHGLAYSVYSFPSIYRYSGNMEIYCGTGPQNVKKVTQLLNEVLSDFVAGGITEKELARAKIKEINGLYMGLEGSMNVMLAYGRRMLKLNEVVDISKRVADFELISKSAVDSMIEKTFSQNYASCYVGKELADFDLISKLKLK